MKIIKFSKYRKLCFLISSLSILGLAIYTFVSGGFNLGVDFQSGLNLDINLNAKTIVSNDDLQGVLDKTFSSYQIKKVGSQNENRFSLLFKDDGKENFEDRISAQLMNILKPLYSEAKQESKYYASNNFSSALVLQVLFLASGSLIIILLYISLRFRINYAISSVIALIHDVLFITFLIGAFKIEVSTATIAAILTIIGYSLNDTIVVFDRIRENENKNISRDFLNVLDTSVTQSLSRTILTSLTTLITILAILIFTTGQISDFALVMLFGVVVGTYSSIYIASPFVYYLTKINKKKKSTLIEKEKESSDTVDKDKNSSNKKEKTSSSTKGIDFEAEKRRIQAKIKNKKK